MLSIVKNLLSFSFFKGIVFLSVILYSYLGFSDEYIELEQSIALATMFTPFLVFGLTMSFSHYNLTEKSDEYDRFYWSHLKYIIYLVTVLSLLFFYFQWPYQKAMLLLVLFVFARFYSQSFKIKNNVFYSSLIDALPYIVITIALGALMLGSSLDVAFYSLFFLMLLLILLLINKKLSSTPKTAIKPYSFYIFGGKAFLVSAVVVTVTMLPRAFAEHLVIDADIENFLLSLRYASISVLFYQFISIKFFTYIYDLKDKRILIWTGLTFGIAFLFTFYCFYFVRAFNLISTTKFDLLSALITAIWITMSFLEYFVSKSNRQNIFIFSVIPLLVFAAYFLLSVTELATKQYMLVVCLVCVLVAQFLAIFYKSLMSLLLSVSVILTSLITFGLYYV